MLQSLNDIFSKHKGGTLLAIFPHPDDESFASGGLFLVARKYHLKTRLICLTKGGRGLNSYQQGDLKEIRANELSKAAEILGIDQVDLWDYPDAGLRRTKKEWSEKIKKKVLAINPDFVITFDHSGMTGHPDHIITCHKIHKVIRQIDKKPLLFWRVPGEKEKKYFKDNHALAFASMASYRLDYSLLQSINKVRAVLAHKSQMQNLRYKLMVVGMLFSSNEFYYQVKIDKTYRYKFVKFKI